ncbi:MAG: DUF2293 domain-containing protein [Acidimicrobiales bacterium]
MPPSPSPLLRTRPPGRRRPAEVGSGRVGRTRTLSVHERAALAARAPIRHRCTYYEDRLANGVWDDEYLYRGESGRPRGRRRLPRPPPHRAAP